MPDPLTQTTVKKLVAAGRPGDYRDARTRGLVLRVGGGGRSTWSFRRTWRGKDYRLDMGGQWSLDEARGIVAEVEARLEADKRQRSRFPWFEGGFYWSDFISTHARRAAGLPDEGRPDDADRVEPQARVPSMSWHDAVERWLGYIGARLRPATVDGYRWALQVQEMRRFHARSVAGVTRIEVAEAVAEIHARAERQANVTAVAVRKLFQYLGRDEVTRKSGVEPERMRLLKAPEDTLVEDEDQQRNSLLVPDGPMVGHLMRALRDGSSSIPERDRLAGMLLLYTVQRRRPVALARREDFEPAEDGGLWKLPPLHRKSASKRKRRGLNVGDHVVCLPPKAWAVVKRAMELAGDSEWLFPAGRRRRADVEPTSMHPSQLTHLFADVPGNPASPHDTRRAFSTTYANEVDLEDYQVKWVLDHAEGVKSGDTTREHYRLTTGEHKKWPVYRGWVDWVDKWTAARD